MVWEDFPTVTASYFTLKFGISPENTTSRKKTVKHILYEVQNSSDLNKGRKGLNTLNVCTEGQYDPG